MLKQSFISGIRPMAKRVLGATVCILCFSSNVVSAEETPIRFGSVAMDIPAVMEKRLKPLTEYLSTTLHRPVVLKLAPDMGSAIKDVASGAVEVAYLTPVAYLKSKTMGNTKLVVKTITEGQGSFKLMIVKRDDNPINSVKQLAGKSFAFGDEGAILQRAVVVGAGINLEDLGSYQFLGHYDNIVRGILHGDYDAGVLKDTMAYKWKDKGITIIYSSPELPPYNITASGHVDDKLLRELQHAFLALDSKNPDHRKVIEALDKKYDGFSETSDKEYDIARDLIKPFSSKN